MWWVGDGHGVSFSYHVDKEQLSDERDVADDVSPDLGQSNGGLALVLTELELVLFPLCLGHLCDLLQLNWVLRLWPHTHTHMRRAWEQCVRK